VGRGGGLTGGLEAGSPVRWALSGGPFVSSESAFLFEGWEVLLVDCVAFRDGGTVGRAGRGRSGAFGGALPVTDERRELRNRQTVSDFSSTA